MEWYRKRAEEFGYDEKSYLEAVRQIPVTDETTFRGVISFLSKIALFVSELGYKGLELETRNAEMERIMYTVSHDLKTPLITIKGFLGLIRKNTQCPGDPKCANYCERIGKATDNMRDLLEQLLSLSRVGRIMSPIIEIPFTGLATEAVGLLSPKITAKGAHVDIQNDMPHVHGEYHRLLETLQNLLENSLKFMGDQKDPRIQIGYRSGHHGNVFYVKDNGIGIEPKYHKKVFNLFDKLDTKTEGTGAGLAIVKRTIEVHGGNVWVESDGKNGTAICFTLGKKAETTEKKDG
jgi:light-regulated signal transduction histidine kinase (bacteriophytochrome)